MPLPSRFLVSALVLASLAALPVRGQRSPIADGGNSSGFDMAPETRPEVVQAAMAALPGPLPAGPVAPTWESLGAHYRVPEWLAEAKFGLFMHWGLYAVPGYHNEWYEKHMYASLLRWHEEHFGPPEQFGYKDFIPRFTASGFDPAAWAALFRKSGAKFVVPTAQHHDNFALWDSVVTPFNAARMGPKRDLIGALARAVRKEGLKFGVSNHGIENFQFVNPTRELAARLQARHADLYDPAWSGFYHVADRGDAACAAFLVDWYKRVTELIDKYQPDILWFDNGVDIRYLDPLKLQVAAYYYNRAAAWGKAVTINTKKAAFAPSGKNSAQIGSVVDFEKIGARSPSDIRTGVWVVDEPIGSTWGYTRDMTVAGPAAIIAKLVDTVSKNGTLLLNLSPTAEGIIPPAQQETLLAVGRWLEINGEAIYGTHNWVRFQDTGPPPPPGTGKARFTVKGDSLFAIFVGARPGRSVVIRCLATEAGSAPTVRGVELLGGSAPLGFRQGPAGLEVQLPAEAPGPYAFSLKITGLKMTPFTHNPSGNPN